MAIESLTEASDFAHLDGALIIPVFIDDYHMLVTEEGSLLMLPNGIQIYGAGRFCIDSNGPHIVRYSDEDEEAVRLWGERLAQDKVQDHLRAQIASVLESYPNPELFINPDCRPEGE